MTTRFPIYLLQCIASAALLLACFVAYDEGIAFIENNSKNFTQSQMASDDLKISFSTHSKNIVMRNCFDAMNSVLALTSDTESNLLRADICHKRADEILQDHPSLSLAWVVKADTLITLDKPNEAMKLLENSQKIAPNESWLAEARIIVALKLSNIIKLQNSDVFLKDATLYAGSTRQKEIRRLARFWKQNEAARPAIENVVGGIDRRQQELFLKSVRN